MALDSNLVRRAIGSKVASDEARHVVEIACLAIAADGELAPEELHVLKILCAELAVDVKAVDEVLALGDREDRLARLRTAAAALKTTQARELAYKMTVLCAVSDLASQDEEFEFDLDVQDALGISSADSDRLSSEVHEALTPDPT
jgi:hypothetical protein